MPSIDQMTRDRIRKMARRGNLIHECFKVISEAVYPNAPPNQLREMRICFFAGAVERFALMNACLDDGVSETDGDLAFMSQWVDELDAFHRKTIAALQVNGHPQ